MPIEPNIDTLSRTLLGEARGEGLLDMLGVAAVIRERVMRPGWWSRPSDNWQSVCRVYHQFSCWNKGDPNREVILNAEDREPIAFRRAVRIAEYTVHCLRDRDVMQLFGIDDVDDIPTHYHDRSIDTPKAWGDKLKEIVPPWKSAFRWYVVYEGRPRRRDG